MCLLPLFCQLFICFEVRLSGAHASKCFLSSFYFSGICVFFFNNVFLALKFILSDMNRATWTYGYCLPSILFSFNYFKSVPFYLNLISCWQNVFCILFQYDKLCIWLECVSSFIFNIIFKWFYLSLSVCYFFYKSHLLLSSITSFLLTFMWIKLVWYCILFSVLSFPLCLFALF